MVYPHHSVGSCEVGLAESPTQIFVAEGIDAEGAVGGFAGFVAVGTQGA